jgi:hypothetical protein
MSLVFISGSSDGLGLLAARLLVDWGHEVTLHARNKAWVCDGAMVQWCGDFMMKWAGKTTASLLLEVTVPGHAQPPGWRDRH